MEPSPGEIDTAYLESLLDILSSVRLQPYLSITTINTVKLMLPTDLMTADEYELAETRHFDDPVIIERFTRLLDADVPLVLSELLVAEVQAAGLPIELHVYEGDNHNISNYWGLAMGRSVAFFDQHVKGASGG